MLGETLAVGGWWQWSVLAAAAVVIVATVGLARGEAASVSVGAGRDVKSTDRPEAAFQA
nr:hypothetical protein [Mycobacterium nebraskense]